MSLRLLDLLSIILLFQLWFIAVFLFTHPKGKRLSNLLLGAFFLAIALNLGEGLFILLGLAGRYPQLAFIGGSCSYLFGPLLYFYTQSAVYRDYRLPKTFFWHTVPFWLVTGMTVFFYHLQPVEMKQFILSARQSYQNPLAVYLLIFAGFGQIFMYTFLSFRTLRRYRQAVQERFSAVDQTNLDWLTFTLRLFLFSMLLGLFYAVLQLTPFTGYYEVALGVLIVVLFYYINRVIFKALRQPELFSGVEPEELAEVTSKPVKYISSGVSAAEKHAYLARLQQLMQTEKPYLNPDLTLEELAKGMNLPVRTLSQVINESLGQNFFDFVNTYRVEEAKRMLTNPADKKITVLEVMYQVGFNSKSSFNTAFKKIAQTTPSEFKKSHAG